MMDFTQFLSEKGITRANFHHETPLEVALVSEWNQLKEEENKKIDGQGSEPMTTSISGGETPALVNPAPSKRKSIMSENIAFISDKGGAKDKCAKTNRPVGERGTVVRGGSEGLAGPPKPSSIFVRSRVIDHKSVFVRRCKCGTMFETRRNVNTQGCAVCRKAWTKAYQKAYFSEYTRSDR
jgi:hypothetical protein